MTILGEPKLHVLVIEDQTLLRRRLMGRLAELPTVRIVGEGGDGLEAFRLTCMYRPDAILLDATLPDIPCIALAERLHQRFADLAIVVLHPQHTSREARSLLMAGARAVISKDAGPDVIEGALRGQAQRMPPEIFPSPATTAPTAMTKALPHRLTERELTVLLLVAKSASNRQIATQLEIREKTVRNHIWHLSAKLGLTRRRDAAEVVASLGLTA